MSAGKMDESRVPFFTSSTCRAAIIAAFILSGANATRAEADHAAASGSADPFRHIQALQDIATANGANRAAGTLGYDLSVSYVVDQLRSAGYNARLEEFTFPFFDERSPPVLIGEQNGLNPFIAPGEALRTLRHSGSGDVAAPLHPVDLGLHDQPLKASTSGCEREDFAGFVPSHIALVRRGTCSFQIKVEHAQAAGASGLIIMNQGTDGQTGTFVGRLETPASIPVLGVTTEVGRRLASAAPAMEVRIKVDVEAGTRISRNVIADQEGKGHSLVVVGAHLDSVPEGPGMNDNASGSSAVLEAALRLAKEPGIHLPIRFAFWGAEERGLVGSRHHLDALSAEERHRILLYINLDMVGSRNFGRFIQIGQQRRTDLMVSTIQALKESFAERNLPVEERVGNQRGFGSDDGAFARRDIPSISLFTGASGTKSEAQAQRFGGEAGQPFDPCYHKACDTTLNVNRQVLEQIAEALIHALRQLSPPSMPSNP